MKKEDGKRSDCYKGIDHTRQIKRRKIKYTTVQKEKHHVDEQESNIREECENPVH